MRVLLFFFKALVAIVMLTYAAVAMAIIKVAAWFGIDLLAQRRRDRHTDRKDDD